MKMSDAIKTQKFANKIHRMTAEMAHYHEDQKPMVTFCFIEMKQPRPHPCKRKMLCMEMVLEIGRGNYLPVWADEQGGIVEDPAQAAEIEQGWDCCRTEREEVRALTRTAMANAKRYARKLGVPYGVKIYDNWNA